MEKSNFKVGFPIGAVFFGSLVGPSMVSGVYSKVYLAPYGAWAFVFALFFPIISGTIIGFSAGLVRRKKVYDYNSFCHELYGKYSRVCTPLMEIYMLMAQLLTMAAVVSMGGTMFNSILGLPTFAGSMILAVACLILVLWGAGLIRRASSAMCVLLVACFLFLAGYCTMTEWDSFAFIMSNWYLPEDANLGSGLWNAILFGFSGACNGMVLCSLMQDVKTRGHAVATGVWSMILTTIVLFLEVLLILPYIPGVLSSEMPTMWVIENHLLQRIPWVKTVYYITMILALITSGVPCLQAMIARIDKLIPGNFLEGKEKLKRLVYGAGFIAVVVVISRLGLTTIVSKGYSSLGFVGILLVFLPTCVLLPIHWHKEKAAATED